MSARFGTQCERTIESAPIGRGLEVAAVLTVVQVIGFLFHRIPQNVNCVLKRLLQALHFQSSSVISICLLGYAGVPSLQSILLLIVFTFVELQYGHFIIVVYRCWSI